MSDPREDLLKLSRVESSGTLEQSESGEMKLNPSNLAVQSNLETLKSMILQERKLLNADSAKATRKGQEPVKKWKKIPPEMFQAETEKITDLYLAGVPPEEIAVLTPLSNAVVAAHIRILDLKKVAERRAERVTAEVIKRKLPLVKESMGLSLAILRDRLLALYEDEEAKAKLSFKELEALSRIGERVNHMLRLETGESTSNIGITQKPKYSFEEAKEMIDKLRQINPIMDYGKEPSSRVAGRFEAKEIEVMQMASDGNGGVEYSLVKKIADPIDPIVVKPS